jgi:3-oxoacyl-[acyl-carrier-protein] synthase II
MTSSENMKAPPSPDDPAGIFLNGYGWITPRGLGDSTGRLLSREPRSPRDLPGFENLFPEKFPNWGRFDALSRKTALAVALALRDMGWQRGRDFKKSVIAIIGCGTRGSLDSDGDYFRDFLEHGEKTGRSHIFIYTLSTSTLAESAILFGLTGPLYALSRKRDPFRAAFEAAADLLYFEQADHVLAGLFEPEGCLFWALGPRTERSLARASRLPPVRSIEDFIGRERPSRDARTS